MRLNVACVALLTVILVAASALMHAGEAPVPGPLPQPLSNNAAAEITVDGVRYVLTFMGLGPGRTWRDISRDTWLWDSARSAWQSFPAVPVEQGRLAAVAVGLAGRVWLFGGYTVAPDGSEVSTPEVFRVDPVARTYERVADMPVPVDDTVAVPYAGRYIYLVSGWHDSGNVADVQLYDTREDEWSAATEFPGTAVFGHAGGIVGNEMVVVGGVGVLGETDGRREFGAIDHAWKGTIDPDDPTRIEWSQLPTGPGTDRYRMAATGSPEHRKIIFAGGTDRPYNYSGVGYDGQPAEPTGAVFAFDPAKGRWLHFDDLRRPATMDHRALLQLDAGSFITVGGMGEGQEVIPDVIALEIP